MTRPNDEAPSGQGKGLQETQQNGQANSTPQTVNVVDSSTAQLIAALVRAGHTVHEGEYGDFLVCRYELSRWCLDLDALRAFAARIGVRHE